VLGLSAEIAFSDRFRVLPAPTKRAWAVFAYFAASAHNAGQIQAIPEGFSAMKKPAKLNPEAAASTKNGAAPARSTGMRARQGSRVDGHFAALKCLGWAYRDPGSVSYPVRACCRAVSKAAIRCSNPCWPRSLAFAGRRSIAPLGPERALRPPLDFTA
jgi:hypothetical protein